MRTRTIIEILLPAILCLASLFTPSRASEYPYRWFFVTNPLESDAGVANVLSLVETASQHGLNGMVLSAGLDMLDRKGPEYFERLARVKEACDAHAIEIIPIVFSVGYGGAVLAHDKNLAAGLPVKDALFAVEDGAARFVPDTSVSIKNGNCEEYDGNRLAGYDLQDRPGIITFVDRAVFKSGHASLRFENFTAGRHGHARLMQKIQVRPYRCYRVSFWVKTEGLEPAGALRMLVLGSKDRDLAPWDPGMSSTEEWRKIVMGFNSMNNTAVRIYVGIWEGTAGTFWIDDLSLEEVGLINVLRRPGTPVTVRNMQTGEVYEEGGDYAPVRDDNLTFRFDHESPSIRILPGSRIGDGERLRVDYYHGTTLYKEQVPVCMSEPELYDIFETQARLMQEHLAPKKYFLSMDEVRAGGTCEACTRRSMTMGQLLGDCITKECAILRAQNPHAEIFTWSDMLDPNHNARSDFYLTAGNFRGSWNHVPKDLVMVCWYYDIRKRSLAFFSSRGFKTLAGAYFDGSDLSNPQGWLRALDKTPGACGILYTTWYDQYELLAPFGDLVSRHSGPDKH